MVLIRSTSEKPWRQTGPETGSDTETHILLNTGPDLNRTWTFQESNRNHQSLVLVQMGPLLVGWSELVPVKHSHFQIDQNLVGPDRSFGPVLALWIRTGPVSRLIGSAVPMDTQLSFVSMVTSMWACLDSETRSGPELQSSETWCQTRSVGLQRCRWAWPLYR